MQTIANTGKKTMGLNIRRRSGQSFFVGSSKLTVKQAYGVVEFTVEAPRHVVIAREEVSAPRDKPRRVTHHAVVMIDGEEETYMPVFEGEDHVQMEKYLHSRFDEPGCTVEIVMEELQ